MRDHPKSRGWFLACGQRVVQNDSMGKQKLFLRGLLIARVNWMEQRLYEGAARNGYGDVQPALSRMGVHLTGKPIGLSELASRLGVSRQAVHKLANEAARQGYVEFVDSPTDARVKLLRFTPAGRKMSASAEQELDAIEQEIAAQIGPQKMNLLKEVLAMPWFEGDRDRRLGS